MGEQPAPIVIVGAGHAGGAAAALLRQYGWRGPITLIGAEPLPPYQRPPLSKAWLKGEADAASLLLRPTAFYATNHIDFRPSQRVTHIDRAAQCVVLLSGERIAYHRLILALGSTVRTLDVPGITLNGVLTLRDTADAGQLQAALRPGARLAVIGGGYIGLEVAASARALGADVLVLEREERLLARVASPTLADFFRHQHAAQGVHVATGVRIEALEGANSAVRGVRLADGRLFECNVVLIGVGAAANDSLARDADLACDGGILVDRAARTSDPAIYAIGDCTRRPVGTTRLRLESVPNALEMAKQAAADISGRPPPAPEVPWFWSDQYDIRLQIAGLRDGTTQSVMRGDPETASFAVYHLAGDGAVLSVEAVNAPADFMAGKTMIARGCHVAATELADPSRSLHELARDVPSLSAPGGGKGLSPGLTRGSG